MINKFIKLVSFFSIVTWFYLLILLLSYYYKVEWSNIQLTSIVILIIYLGVNKITSKLNNK